MNTIKLELSTDRQKRNSSIELLRILAMMMITFHHFAVHGGFEWSAYELTIPHFWYNFIIMGGKVGVNIFVLISGYFLINDSGALFHFKKILKIWGQIFFYSIILYVIFSMLGMGDFEINSLIKACFPITFGSWWFASTYFVLYLIHPFLNKTLDSFDKKTYQTFLVLCIICWSIIPTFTAQKYEGNNLLWFITLYSIAGYVNRYGLNEKLNAKKYFILWIIFSALTYLSSVIFTIMGEKREWLSAYSTYFYEQESISILLISLTLFMTFISIKMRPSTIINTVASATFGVYLIHEDNRIRQFLWIDLFKNSQFQQSIKILPYSILVVLLIYIVCTLIDLIRQRVFEKPYLYIVNKYSHTWLKPIKQIISFCNAFVFGDK